MNTACSAVSTLTTEYSERDILSFLIQSDIIKMNDVETAMKQAELKKFLKQHPYAITQGKDGRYRTYIKTADGRKQIAKSTLEKLNYELYEHYKRINEKKQKSLKTLEELFPVWLAEKELHGAAPQYIKRLKNDWKQYYSGTEIVKIPIKSFDKHTLDIWAHTLIKQHHLSKKQYYNVSCIIRQALVLAVDLGIIKDSPFTKIRINYKKVFPPTKKKSNETQVYTDDEFTSFCEIAWAEFYDPPANLVHLLSPLATLFMFQTGVRISEICVLRYEDIFDSEICVQRMYRYQEKEVVSFTKGGNEERFVPLTKLAKQIIAIARCKQQELGVNDNGYIFSINDEPLSYYAIRHCFNRYCRKIGISEKSSHKARKTFISALLDANINVNSVREMVGHADEKTTYNSYCYDRKTKTERIQMIENALS